MSTEEQLRQHVSTLLEEIRDLKAAVAQQAEHIRGLETVNRELTAAVNLLE